MKYVLLFCGTQDDQREFDALTPEQVTRRYDAVDAWFAEHAEHVCDAQRLLHPDTATTVRLRPGPPVMVDGPYLEGHEIVGGFAVVEVADLDEALAMATSLPVGHAVEIRPLVDRLAR